MSTQTDTQSQRVAYNNGILLDASDFQQEQTYHRSRLALALAYTQGFGTIAGLKVQLFPIGSIPEGTTTPRTEEQLVVFPGIALDRAGRLIEVKSAQSLRLDAWFKYQVALPGATLTPYQDGAGLRYFVGDLFLSYNECPQGLRPGFPEPDADATDAVVASRTNDSFQLQLVVRDCNPETSLPSIPSGRFPTPIATRADLLTAIYAAYPTANATLDAQYPPGFTDTTSVFLSRVRIRLKDTPSTTLDRNASTEVVIDDLGRPVIAPSDLLTQLIHS